MTKKEKEYLIKKERSAWKQLQQDEYWANYFIYNNPYPDDTKRTVEVVEMLIDSYDKSLREWATCKDILEHLGVA